MARQRLTDGSGRWLDLGEAKSYYQPLPLVETGTIKLDGRRWGQQTLYYTRKGAWVLNSWDPRVGDEEDWREIDAQTASIWLLRNNYTAAMLGNHHDKELEI